jgi:hypothetical protein
MIVYLSDDIGLSIYRPNLTDRKHTCLHLGWSKWGQRQWVQRSSFVAAAGIAPATPSRCLPCVSSSGADEIR